jgi:ADP-ribose pyrophosphatase YjhB (NUDIX family)
MTMISTMIGSARFNVRVAGVWIDDGHVLLQGDEREEDFWTLPGGRVEIMEPVEAALRREMREELAIGDDLRVGRLLWIIQNIFQYPEPGDDHHELGFYFLMTPGQADTDRLCDKRRDHPCAEPETTLRFRWFPLAEVAAGVLILPTFLNAALQDLPSEPRIITHDARPG